jgi:clan AA aspartic protease
VVSIKLKRAGAAPAVVVTALVDTGADISVIPQHIARQLRLPFVRRIQVFGVDGSARFATVNSVEVEIPGFQDLVEAVAFGNEALIGRDLLNRWVAHLDGPQGLLRLDALSSGLK